MTGRDFEALQVVALVVEQGSFTAAATARDVSQPAISMQVRGLEARLGVRLLERIGRGVRPTAAGHALLEHVRRIRVAAADAQQAMEPFREGASGRVRIGTGATACIHLLPGVLRRIRERMPGLEIVVETGNSSDTLRRIEDNELDLGLVTLPATSRSLEVRPIFADELVAVFGRGDGRPAGPATPAALAAVPLALYEPGGQTRTIIAGWFGEAGVQPRPAMQIGSIEAIKKLVEAGICASIIPRLALGDPRRQGLVAEPLSPPLPRWLGIALRRDKRLDRGLREMVLALGALSGDPGPGGPGPA